MTASLERILYAGDARFLEWLGRREQPLLVGDLQTSWAASVRWTLDWFSKELGDAVVQVDRGRLDYDSHPESERMRLSEFIRLERSRPADVAPGYVSQHDPRELSAPLAEDFQLLELPTPDHIEVLRLWLSGPTRISQLHCDHAPNLLAQVHGTKRVRLFRPDCPAAKYPVLASDRTTHSRLGFDARAFAAHEGHGPPALEPDIEVDLEGGDSLYIPSGWWHDAVSLTESVSLTRWWSGP